MLFRSVSTEPTDGEKSSGEIEAVADYLLAKVIGRGELTRGECEEAYGEGARMCNRYPAGP